MAASPGQRMSRLTQSGHRPGRNPALARRGVDRRVSVHVKDGAVHTPFDAKPTMSADPFPLMSASWRGKALPLLQPPALAPKAESWNVGDAKCPPPVAKDV